MTDYAVIGKVKLQKIEGAKTIQYAYYAGLPFVVGLDVNETDLYVIFLPDGQLSAAYAAANDCVDRGKDKQGNKLGGFFGKNRKVRSLKLMGGKVTSVGYIAPLSSLSFAGDITKLKEGDVVDTFNGCEIARKYEVPTKKVVVNYKQVDGFKRHPDTDQFYKRFKEIEAGSLITITEKLHGTSARYAYLPVERKAKWWEKLLDLEFIFGKRTRLEYRKLAGTRNVVLSDDNPSSYYGNNKVWLDWLETVKDKLLQGESVYGEIVGWLDYEKPIQKAGGVQFTYDAEKGDTRFFVYNLRHQMPNGYSYDLSWEQVQMRCREMGLEVVPQVYHSFIYDGDADRLAQKVYLLTDGISTIGNHLREGVVLRIEKDGKVWFLKSKSKDFLVLEDASKNAGETNVEDDQ